MLAVACLGSVLAAAVPPLFAGGYPKSVDLNRLVDGAGSEIQGVSMLEETAHSLSAGGDLNGDGFADLAIGAHEASLDGMTLNGTIYVVFGGFSMLSQFELAQLDGANGFTVVGLESFDTLGKAVSLRGDLNGDGLDDLVLGAPFADPEGIDGAGAIYVIYGSTDPFPAVFDLTTLDGTNGFAIYGPSILDQVGSAVDLGPDVDGDGFQDLAIGAPGANDPNHGGLNSGETYVLYGGGSYPAILRIDDLLPENGGDGSELWTMRNGETGAEVGVSASLSADLNSDGLADLITGAWLSDAEGRFDAGTVYVIFGRADRPAETDLASLDGTDGFALLGAAPGDEAGYTVGHGDVNRDGVPDVLLGAPKASPGGLDEAGEAYIVFGGASSTPPTIDLATLTDPVGVRIPGLDDGDENGWSVSGTEDVDGDGFCDLLIGARSVGPLEVGHAYLIYGQDVWGGTFDLDTLNGTVGSRFVGGGETGFSLTAYADLNGDDTTDLVIGAPKGDPNGLTNAGIAYLLYGPKLSLTLAGHCPSPVEVHVHHATPHGAIELYWSDELGEDPVPEGDCVGTALALDDPQRIGISNTSLTGSFSLERRIPREFCGAYLQVVDLTTCEVTAAREIPDAIGEPRVDSP